MQKIAKKYAMENFTKEELQIIIKHMTVNNLTIFAELTKRVFDRKRSDPDTRELFGNFVSMFAFVTSPMINELKEMIPNASSIFNTLQEHLKEINPESCFKSYMKPGKCACPMCRKWEPEIEA